MAKPRVTSHASELTPDNRYCTCCEKELSGKFAWLELDQSIDEYHDLGNVPFGKSQGWFPFGMTCAEKFIRAAEMSRAALAERAKDKP